MAIGAVTLAILGIALIAGSVLHRQKALHDLALMMYDPTLLTVSLSGAELQGKEPARGHLEFSDADALRKVDGVVNAAPAIRMAVEAKAGREVYSVPCLGVTGEYLTINRARIMEGRAAKFRSTRAECMITPEVADLFFGYPKDAIGKTLRLNGHKFTVTGVVQADQGMDREMCLVGPDAARRVRNIDHPTSIQLRVADDESLGKTRREVEGVLSGIFGKGIGAKMVSSRLDTSFKDFLAFNKGVVAQGVFLILGLFIAIATVAELLYADIQANMAEIGTLRALGARKSDIIGQIAFQGIFICLLGGIVGVGLTQSYYFWPETFRQQLRFMSSFEISVFALGIAFLAGVVASLLPAYSALAVPPITTMREGTQQG